MCGIVGFTGRKKAVPYLINCLEKLEYRGYDSAGIAVNEKDGIAVTKCKGKLSVLESVIASKKQSSALTGIGHTRWATHGKPDSVNAHPHLSQKGTFAVVHNGIIENFAEIKNQLIKEGFTFKSETDSEVIAQLLEKYYEGDVLSSLKKTLSLLKGSYAVAVLCKDFPDEIYCSRFGSPIVLGENEDGFFISSDVTSILTYTDEIYRLSGGETARVTKKGVSFFDGDMNETVKQKEKVDFVSNSAEKDGFSHFMLKEIYEQEKVIKETFDEYVKKGEISFPDVKLTKQELMNIKRVIFIACGSAYHVGLTGKEVFEKLTGIYSSCEIASQWRYGNSPADEGCLAVVISQSGETADTLAALKKAKQSGAKTVSIVNVRGSSIAEESDNVIYTKAGPEIAVATTKAYSCQLIACYLFAIYFAENIGKITHLKRQMLLKEISDLSGKVKQCLFSVNDKMKALAKEIFTSGHIYFIGRGADFAVAMEGALKLKEISYIHCEAYAAGELKHGTISLIEKGTCVIVLCCDEEIVEKTVSNAAEVRSRGGKLIAFSNEKGEKYKDGFHELFVLPSTYGEFTPSVEVIPLQLLAFYTALERGCDIDKPRNLAKSVTVE